MWLPYVVLVAAWSGSVLMFPQNGSPSSNFWSPNSQGSFEADGFVFDGPTNGRSTGANTPPTAVTPTPPVTTTTTTTTTPTTTTTTTATPTTPAQMGDCIRTCPVTPEYNPVCGSDNVLYDNPGILNCAAFCGKTVTLRYYGPCMSNLRG